MARIQTELTWVRPMDARNALPALFVLLAQLRHRRARPVHTHHPATAGDARFAQMGGSSQMQEPAAACSAAQVASARQARALSFQPTASLGRLRTHLRSTASLTALRVCPASRALAARRGRQRAALASMRMQAAVQNARHAKAARTSLHATQRAARAVSKGRFALRAHRRRSLAPRARTQAQPTLHRQSSAVPARPARAAQRAAPRPQHARRAASHPRLVAQSARRAMAVAIVRRQMAPRAMRATREGTIARVVRRRCCRARPARDGMSRSW